MPRALRATRPLHVYHLISRFVGGEWFMRGAEERRLYLRLLGISLRQSDWRCLGYALMSTHIHLEAVAGAQPLADWLRGVHGPFAKFINERERRIGSVFVRGPKDFLVRADGVARVTGYIHRNPVRAGVVSDPRDSDWTSHRAYVGLAERPPWLDTELGLELAGFRDAAHMDSWIRATDIDRAAAKAALVPPKRGRPRKELSLVGASPEPALDVLLKKVA
jgi:putative transposase